MRPRRLLAATLACCAAAALPAAAAGHDPAAPAKSGGPTGFWVAGDLHVHTIYGHDTCITPTEAWDPSSASRDARRSCADPYTVGFSPVQRLDEAAGRGLDFVALTDHNNVLNQSDPAVLAWKAAHPDFAVIPGYENSQPGHVQMLGATACYGNAGRIDGSVIECDQQVSDRSAAGETALANGLRADGGVFQVNHPSDGNWPGAFGYSVVPDTVEVWNIGPWAYQHPLPASNDNNFSLRWYDGLRAHHTFVSALPPAADGPQLFLEADRNHDGRYDAIAGDEVPAGAAYRVRTVNAVPGSVLRIISDTGSVEIPLGTATTYDFVPGTGGVPTAASYVRAELLAPDGRAARTAECDPVVGSQTSVCRDDLAMESLSSPLFIR